MQNGFRLVAGVVCKKNPVGQMTGKRFVTHVSSRRLDSFASCYRDIHAEYFQRNLQLLADPLAGVRPGIGIRAQSMMNMQGRKLDGRFLRLAGRGVKQGRGIEPARKADDDGLARPCIAQKTGRNSLQNGLSEWFVP
jgi:hypothetical protein